MLRVAPSDRRNLIRSEVLAADGSLAAHYEYAPFGALKVSRGTSAATNPFRFSSEYAEDDTATVYYNYRHYAPVMGRWLGRDDAEERGGINLYFLLQNDILQWNDYLGECCSVCGYVDYPALGAGSGFGHRNRNRRKEPCLWDQFGILDDPFHQEQYFESRYGAFLEAAKLHFKAYIVRKIDCKSESVRVSEAGGRKLYNPGSTKWPFVPCEGGTPYDGVRPQGWCERWCAEGSFTLLIEQPIKVEYQGGCENCQRRFRWSTIMYVVDELGVSKGDRWPVSWLRPFAPGRVVRRAEWEISGEGTCKCEQ